VLGDYIVFLFNVRTAAHILHLQSDSLSEHKALNSFYDELIPLADKLAEVLRGIYGNIKYPTAYDRLPTSSLALLKRTREKTIEAREAVEEHPNVQNIIDEITSLIDETTYLIRQLK
jgi:DNA-binding ferritin-like protein